MNFKKMTAIVLAMILVLSIPVVASASSYSAALNVNWSDRSTQTITGAGTYVFTADLTYDSEVQYAAITIPNAYSALSGYNATLKVEAGGNVLYDSAYTLTAQWVDDGTGNYVPSDNCYIELYASWNGSNLVQSIPGGGTMTVTLTLSGEGAPEATEPSTEATEPSTEATEPSTEATEPSSEATEPSTEATEPSTEVTEPSTEATEPAVGNAFLCFSDADWWPGVSNASDTTFSTYVSGPGTYTISWDLSTFGWQTSEGISVFYIDIMNAYSNLKNCKVSSVSITADGAAVPVKLGNVKTYNSDGAYRIELYNMYASGSQAVDGGLTFSQNLTVTFTLQKKADSSNPDTGDFTSLTAVCGAMAASALALIALVPAKKKFF